MMNKKTLKIIILILILVIIGLIIGFIKLNNKDDDNLIEKVMKENSDYKYVDIGIYDKKDADYEYSEFNFNISFDSSESDSIDIGFKVQDGKLIYNFENTNYESTKFNNIKKATGIVDGTIGAQCMMVLLTNDGDLYKSSANNCYINGKIEIKQLISDIDNSFEKINLLGFKVDDFKLTYNYANPILVAIDSNNNKKLLTCSRESNCELLTEGLGVIKTVGMGQDSYVINKDGSVIIGTIDEQIKYNNDILKIQTIFEEGYSNNKYIYYIVDRQGYLYKLDLMFNNEGEEYYNISKLNESLVKKIGYKDSSEKNVVSLIFIFENGSTLTSTTHKYNMFDFNNKIGE